MSTVKAFLDLLQQIVALLKDPMMILVIVLLALLLGGYWCFSAYVGSLEMPGAEATAKQRQRFRFLNILAANLKRAAKAVHVPGEEAKDDQSKGASA